jgi:hypothetical protein
MINSRKMKWVEYIAHIGSVRNAFTSLGGKPDPLG